MNNSQPDRLRARARELARSLPVFDGLESYGITSIPEPLSDTFLVFDVVDETDQTVARYLTSEESQVDCETYNGFSNALRPHVRMVPRLARIANPEHD